MKKTFLFLIFQSFLQDIQKPEETWFWPPQEVEKDDDVDEERDEDEKEPENDFEVFITCEFAMSLFLTFSTRTFLSI